MKRLLTASVAVAAFGCTGAISTSAVAEGAWKFEVEQPREQPILRYIENDKLVFLVGCGHAVGLHIKYPAMPKKKGKATITLANSKTSMKFVGEFEPPDDKDDATTFLQWDLGYRRQDPKLYGKAWERKLESLFDLLTDGGPITVSAKGRSYQIPAAVTVGDWRKGWHEHCL